MTVGTGADLGVAYLQIDPLYLLNFVVIEGKVINFCPNLTTFVPTIRIVYEDMIEIELKYMKKVLLFFSLVFAIAAQADVLGEYSFEGTLGDKIPVRLKFAVNGDEIAVGEIYYPKAKNPAPILVVGSPTNDEGWYYLKEYQSDGTITGTMLFHIVEEENENPYIAEGTWTNPRTEKSLLMKNFSTNDDALTGRIDVTDYLDYEDPQNIGREYAYSIWNPRYGSMMGGNVRFRRAGKYKLHFEISYIADVDLPTSRLPSS